MASETGSLLSAREIITAIDRAGNQNGIAETEDFAPHLDGEQKISTNAVPFRQALQSLNRICGNPSDVFHLPTILRCPVFQNNRLQEKTIEKAGHRFIWRQLERLFLHNPNATPVIKERFNEFRTFVTEKEIPLWQLFAVLENKFIQRPLESSHLENAPLNLQMECLFQLSGYAAMWHLKYNVRAFAPEELAKYPDWFRKKVGGFEEAILKKLQAWQLAPELGKERQLFISYNGRDKKIITPDYDPFPPILGDAISVFWHEAFHAYRDTPQVVAESVWASERDALLVQFIGLLKMEKVTNPHDEEGLKRLAIRVESNRLPSQMKDRLTEGTGEGWKEAIKHFVLRCKYAIHFASHRKNQEVKAAFERQHLYYVLSSILAKVYGSEDFSNARDDHQKYLLVKQAKFQLERDLQVIQNGTYEWVVEGGAPLSLAFPELLRKTNSLLEERSGELDEGILLKLRAHLQIINEYLISLVARELFAKMVENFEKNQPHWGRINALEDLPNSLQFLENHKWLSIYTSPP